MTDRIAISQNLTELRKATGLTQNELADKLHVSHQAISQWERSETLPDILTLPALADIFAVSVDRILGRENKTEPVGNVPVLGASDTDASERILLGKAEPNCDYTVMVASDMKVLHTLPLDLQHRLILVLEGDCRDLTTTCSADIQGDVHGEVTVSGGLTVGGSIEGDVVASGDTTINGDIAGDVAVSGGSNIQGNIAGDVTISGTCTIQGDIAGDVTTDHDLTISGDVNGDVVTHDDGTVQVQGNIEGDVDCGNCQIGGNVGGSITADGDVVKK